MKKHVLRNTSIPNLAMKHHKAYLRRALLTSAYWDRKQDVQFLFWKGGEKEMQKRRFLAITISAFMVVLALTVVLMPKNTQKAYAEQIAQESFNAITSLNTEELKNLKEKVKLDSKDILEKAKRAKDLKYLTYDEYVKAHPEFAHMPTPPSMDGHEAPDIKNAQFLEFTDTDGAKVTIAIDPNNDLPFFITKQLFKGDGKALGESGNTVFRMQKEGTNDIKFQVKTDGKSPVLEVNGKKYELSNGYNLNSGTPPDIKFQGKDLYVNGQKAKPIE
jgi:hypothetical protein